MIGTSIRNVPFPELGKIYPGKSSLWGSAFQFDIAEEEEDIQRIIDSTLCKKLKKLTVMLPHRYVDENFERKYIARQNNLTIAVSNGKTMQYWLDIDSFKPIVSCGVAVRDYPELGICEGQQVAHRDIVGMDNDGQPVQCNPYGKLAVMIPELRRIAYFTLRLNELKDQLSIEQELSNIYNSTKGDIRNIPIDIYFGFNYFQTRHGIRKRSALTASVSEDFKNSDVFDPNIFKYLEGIVQEEGVGIIP